MKITPIGEPYWDKAPVFIIGGGSSLIGFDFNTLQCKGIILAVNKAIFLTKHDAGFSLDNTFIANYKPTLCNTKSDIYLAIPPQCEDWRLKVDGVHYLERRRGIGLCEDVSAVHGTNSGFGALNLAFHKKAKTIYLLGFDMQNRDKKLHWHDGYSWQDENARRFYDRWAMNFKDASYQLNKAGVSVYNCNNESGIDAFEKIGYKILEQLPYVKH